LFNNRRYRKLLDTALSREAILRFKPSDVRYLIMSKEAYIPRLIDEINSARGQFQPTQKKILTSRIISFTQVLQDF
jgi:hypothetical protein